MKTAGKIIIGFALGAGLATAVTVVAHNRSFCMGGEGFGGSRHGMFQKGSHHAEFIVERIGDKLDLNAEQSDQLNQTVDELLALAGQFREQRGNDRDKVLELIAAQSLDQKQVLDMVNAKTTLVETHAPAVVARVAKFLDGLSPSQKQEVVEMLEWRMGGRHRWH